MKQMRMTTLGWTLPSSNAVSRGWVVAKRLMMVVRRFMERARKYRPRHTWRGDSAGGLRKGTEKRVREKGLRKGAEKRGWGWSRNNFHAEAGTVRRG